MNKVILIFFLHLLFTFSVQAQKYRSAVGVRIGRNDFGFTGQQKILKKTTLEAIGAVSGREVSATGLIEQHFPILGPGFNIYLGAGAHIGHLKDNGTYYGGDLIAGAELKLPIVPLVLSLDLKPTFHINHEEWGGVGSGFSIRYILVKEKKEKKKLFGIFNRKDDNRNSRKNKKIDSGGWFRRKKKEEEKPKSWFKRIFDKNE
ncbi:hypothetical protein [Adhaeribacter pallidiroseus]|uniref:Outer membrane protein beta-barrel domain-containing protein n=1 Tax=Adhaeribacter pallidiroseus TaxID=2072847 RepID=A0A369QEW6_9BACT|nr:hypothetical protein [Adhaeribacter pallidiroseus]RDC62115.1 hypothetical protein AHMF7616_00706 [Adhaeribacter pallidiroseus]